MMTLPVETMNLTLFDDQDAGRWVLSSSSDYRALQVVDGTGPFEGQGPHYSRRTPGSKTFTGCGKEVVLVTKCGRAVWACVYQKTPSAVGTGGSRGRDGSDDPSFPLFDDDEQLTSTTETRTGTGQADPNARFIWRNMLFRNLGAGLSSDLIREATDKTYAEWRRKYGSLPPERLRTEIGIEEVRSRNPGYCYLMAGWERGPAVRGKRYLYAPLRPDQVR